MKDKKINFLLILILLAGMTFSGLITWLYFDSAKEQAPLSEAELTGLLSRFRHTSKPHGVLEIVYNDRERMPLELRDPSTFLPDPRRYQRDKLNQLLQSGIKCQYQATAFQSAQEKKLLRWFDFKCGKVAALSPAVWREAPLIHPLGGSWAYWLFNQGFGSKEWLVSEKNYLHVLEGKYLEGNKLSASDKIIADFSAADLESLNNGASLILTEHYLLDAPYFLDDKVSYQIHSSDDWRRILAKNNIVQKNDLTPACEIVLYGQCWQRVTTSKISPVVYFVLMMCSVLGLTLSLALALWSKWRAEKMYEENQQLVMQTLTHELRLPVTGLKLVVGSLRENYDDFAETTKKDFLRLTEVTERMHRLVHMSHQYLKLLSTSHEFSFRKENISSVNEFMQELLESFMGDIELRSPEHDFTCVVDVYWLGTCIVNLVNNSFAHGKKPVIVGWSKQGKDLVIFVQDAGLGPQKKLKELIVARPKSFQGEGLGLGLSLVARLMACMGGSLALATGPTCFTLTLKGACDGK